MLSQLNLTETLLLVLTGISVIILILLIAVLIVSLKDKSKKPEKAVNEIVSADDSCDESELIAVITAAAMAVLEPTGKNYVIRSVRRTNNRPAWATAGLLRNTRSF